MKKALTSLLMSAVMFFLCLSPLSVSAQTANKYDIDKTLFEEECDIATIKETFAAMSIEELQSYINSIANVLCTPNAESTFSSNLLHPLNSPNLIVPIPVVNPLQPLKNAWLAAAAIARKMGYSASATLVEHSIERKNYIEFAEKPFNTGSSLFKDKIVKTNAYKSYIANPTSGISFERNDDSDLFFALHECYCDISTVNSNKTIYIGDTYDFKLMSYDSPFVGIINNFALLNQMLLVLYPIKIHIAFYV